MKNHKRGVRAQQRRWANALMISTLLLATIPPASAFESVEHREIADLSLIIALDMGGSSNPKCDLRDAHQLLPPSDRRSTLPSNQAVTYGEIASRVDFMLSPLQILNWINVADANGKIDHLPRSHRELNDTFVSERSNLIGEGLRASHNNEAHFQGELLSTLRMLQDISLRVSQEGYLFSALILNAAASHYLADFFAPGHLATPRENFHDAFALGMHDVINNRGANFEIDATHWSELEEVIQFIRRRPDHYGFDAKTIDNFLADHSVVRLKGDNTLSLPANGGSKQSLLMIAVHVQLVRDVFKACGSSESVNRFAEYSWRPRSVSWASKTIVPPKAGIRYGMYHFTLTDGVSYSPVVGLSATAESFLSGSDSTRMAVGGEIVPFGWPGSPNFLRDSDTMAPSQSWANVGLSLGYTYIQDDDFHAHGPSTRFIMAWPQVDTSASVYYRPLLFSVAGHDRWGHGAGLRFDMGFSVFTAYAGVGYDHTESRAGHLRSGLLLSGGLTVAGPVSRIQRAWPF